MTVTSESRQGRFHTYFYTAAVLILWIATHGFVGVWRDAQFYVFQAMARLDPATFSDDLFLRYGTQDRFSIVGGIFTSVISWIGIKPAYVVLLVGAELLWLTGALFLVRGIFSSARLQFAALFGLILLPPFYGCSAVSLHYAEAYLTPRLIGEGLSLFALGFAFRKAWWPTFFSLGLALVTHPLMALPVAGVIFLLAERETKKAWALVPVGVTAVLGLALAGIDPFSHIFQFFSDEWWQSIVQRNAYGLFSEWAFQDYARLGVQAFIGCLAFVFGSSRERVLLRSVAFVSIGCFFLALIGSLWVHNVLLVEAQLYRVGWLLALVVNMTAGALFSRMAERKALPAACLALGLALYGLDRFFPSLFLVAFVLLVAGAVAVLYAQKRIGGKSAPLSLFAVTCACCSLTVAIIFLQVTETVKNPVASGVIWEWLAVLFAGSAIAVYRHRQVIGIVFLTAALTAALWGFDRRNPWERYIWSEDHPPQVFASKIEDSKNVYWEDGLGLLWFNLRRPSYFSFEQGASAIIYENVALSFFHRCRVLSLIHPSDACVRGNRSMVEDFGKREKIEQAQLAEVCQALPDLDIAILSSDIAGAPRLEWKMPVARYLKTDGPEGPSYEKKDRMYYLYECRDYR